MNNQDRAELQLIEIEITTNCNKSCEICYLGDSLNSGQMSSTTLKVIVDAAHALGVEHIVLTGGEPLLHPHFEAIVDIVNGIGLRPGILTNGVALTRKRASSLQGRVSFVQLSLHDLPGRDLFAARIARRVLELKELGLPVSLLITVSARTLDRATQLMDFAEGVGVPFGVQRFCQVPGKNLHDFVLPPGPYQRTLAEVWERLQKSDLMACEDPLLNRFMSDERVTKVPDSVWIGCAAARWAALVTTRGDLVPCAKLRISGANVLDVGLEEAWNSELFQTLREPYPESDCASCKHFRVCRGCRAEAYHSGLGLWGRDPLCPAATA